MMNQPPHKPKPEDTSYGTIEYGGSSLFEILMWFFMWLGLIGMGFAVVLRISGVI